MKKSNCKTKSSTVHYIYGNLNVEDCMFAFIEYTREKMWTVSFNPLFPRTYFRGGINGGIERITFQKLWEEFSTNTEI